MTTNIAIIGAGPAGLTLAISLARRGIPSTVFEGMDNPFKLQKYNPSRSYAIDITGHGLKAIKHIDAVESFNAKLIKFNGLKLNGRIMSRWTEPGWIGSRGDIVCVLTKIATCEYSEFIDLRFQQSLEQIDVHEGSFTIKDAGNSASAHYGPFDLIVAADGGGSKIRQAAELQDQDYQLRREQIPFFFKMLALDKNTESLDPNYLHVLSKSLLMVAGAINGPNGKEDPLWFSAVPYRYDRRYESTQAVMLDMEKRCPSVLEYCSESALKAFSDLPAQNTGRITSSSKLYAGKVVFLGDAAISYPPIGQGINGAMESAMVLDQVLSKSSLDYSNPARAIAQAQQEFSELWLPETQAVAWVGKRTNQANRWHVLRAIFMAFLGISVMDLTKSSTLSYSQAVNRSKIFGPIWWA